MSGERKLFLWRLGLGMISLINISLWLGSQSSASDAYGSRQWALAGIFTAVCAFRAVLPRIDLERYVLVDHWLSSIFLGRSAATVAELSFAAQCALLLREVSGLAGAPALAAASAAVVPALALAQLCCWYSVATLSHAGHAVEESLWALTHAGIGLCLAAILPRVGGPLRAYLACGTALAAGYVAFMVWVDVPMYVRRWKTRTGPYLPLGRGLRDALVRRVPARRWEDWREETAWLTLYFSAAVWISLAMIRLPRG